MKRYKSFLLIGIVGALFAACDKELKQTRHIHNKR